MEDAQIVAMIADREAGTPGLWVVDGPVWNQIVWTDNENRLCYIAHSNGLNDERDKANARRITRVPDMEATIIAQAAELERLRSAIEALGAMPEGYCFCSKDRIGDDSKTHEPECADLREALKGGA